MPTLHHDHNQAAPRPTHDGKLRPSCCMPLAWKMCETGEVGDMSGRAEVKHLRTSKTSIECRGAVAVNVEEDAHRDVSSRCCPTV